MISRLNLGALTVLLSLFPGGSYASLQQGPSKSDVGRSNTSLIGDLILQLPELTGITQHSLDVNRSYFSNKALDLVRKIAEFSTTDIGKAIKALEARDFTQNHGRVFILNRYLFNVPQWSEKRFAFAAFNPVPVQGNKLNVLWPLAKTRSGALYIKSAFRPNQFGEIYHPSDEYMFFSKNYMRRSMGAYATSPTFSGR